MRSILVQRNGGRSMVFTGRLIARADDSEVSDRRPIYEDCLTLWTLTLYETKEGDYVLSSEYDAYSPKRISLKDTLRFASPEALLMALERDGHTHAELTRLLLRRAAQTSEAFAPRRERRAPLYPPAMQQESPNQPELLAECA